MSYQTRSVEPLNLDERLISCLDVTYFSLRTFESSLVTHPGKNVIHALEKNPYGNLSDFREVSLESC